MTVVRGILLHQNIYNEDVFDNEFRISIDQDTSSDIQPIITYKAMRYVKDRSILYTSNAI